MRIISIGEILWDVFPDRECLGGAPFNLAAHASRLGHEVYFVSAVGDDDRGRLALHRMEQLGLPRDYVRTIPGFPTGYVTIELTDGQPDYTIHRPAAYDMVDAPPVGLQADWICFGTLLACDPAAMGVIRRVVGDNPGARRFYDVNLRRDSWSPYIVRTLAAMATIVKLNEEESRTLGMEDRDNTCITRAERGCRLRLQSQTVDVPGDRVAVVDAVGAGDAWSAAFLHGFHAGWPLEQIGAFANRLGALVASRPSAIPDWSLSELRLQQPA